MADRYYEQEDMLECGCMISLDGGGGLIPCCYPGYGATEEEIEKCDKAWDKYRKSKKFKRDQREINRRNS